MMNLLVAQLQQMLEAQGVNLPEMQKQCLQAVTDIHEMADRVKRIETMLIAMQPLAKDQ